MVGSPDNMLASADGRTAATSYMQHAARLLLAGRACQPLTLMLLTEPTLHALMSALKAVATLNMLCDDTVHGRKNGVLV